MALWEAQAEEAVILPVINQSIKRSLAQETQRYIM